MGARGPGRVSRLPRPPAPSVSAVVGAVWATLRRAHALWAMAFVVRSSILGCCGSPLCVDASRGP
jgi:hypothetical protein